MINFNFIDLTDRRRLKRRLHILIASLISLIFILIIARLAIPGTPVTRTNVWGIAVVCSIPHICPLPKALSNMI